MINVSCGLPASYAWALGACSRCCAMWTCHERSSPSDIYTAEQDAEYILQYAPVGIRHDVALQTSAEEERGWEPPRLVARALRRNCGAARESVNTVSRTTICLVRIHAQKAFNRKSGSRDRSLSLPNQV